MSQPANRFSVKKSGSPLKTSKHQDKTNLISATDDGEYGITGYGISMPGIQN